MLRRRNAALRQSLICLGQYSVTLYRPITYVLCIHNELFLLCCTYYVACLVIGDRYTKLKLKSLSQSPRSAAAFHKTTFCEFGMKHIKNLLSFSARRDASEMPSAEECCRTRCGGRRIDIKMLLTVGFVLVLIAWHLLMSASDHVSLLCCQVNPRLKPLINYLQSSVGDLVLWYLLKTL